MCNPIYLICHKDHPLDPVGFNGGAEMATIYLARYLTYLCPRVIVAAELKGLEQKIHGVEFWDLGADWDVRAAIQKVSALGPYYLISAGRAQPLVEAKCDAHCLARLLVTHDRSINDTGLKADIVCRLADYIICVSQAQREILIKGGADSAKLKVINNGVDLELYTPADFAERDPWKLVFAGALVEDKGIHFLLESFAHLKKKYPKLTLDIYGSAALWGRAEFLDSKQVEQTLPGVKFYGNVERQVLAQAYRRAALLVYPSIWFEPFGLSAADALATGCPVVAFDVGGPRDIVRDGENGRLLKEVSVAALTDAIAELLSDESKRQGMSKRALELRSRFDWRKVAMEINSLCRQASSRRPSGAARPLIRGRFGFVTTWNQQCGLATYARYLLNEFEPGSYLVLGEEAELLPGAVDEPYVRRCWKRGSSDFERLYQVIKEHDLKLVHLNCHYRFFPQPAAAKFLQQLRDEGLKVVVHLHNPYTLDQQLSQLVLAADLVIVHTPENRLEVIANGASPAKVAVLTHGVSPAPPVSETERLALRQRLGMPSGGKVVMCFGFIQPHKGMEALIEGLAHLSRAGLDCYGYIVGRPLPGDPHGHEYLQKLTEYAATLGVASRLVVLNRFVSDEEVVSYLQAADVVLMNYRSQYYEASGACALAVGAGAVVAASTAPPLMAFGDAVWHLTTGYPVPLALEILLHDNRLREAIQENAQRYCRENSWLATRRKLERIYAALGFKAETLAKEKDVETKTASQAKAGIMRVLMQNRPTAFSHPGGDTVVMQKTAAGLRSWGVEVTIDLEGREDPAGYDLVHLFNFAMPDLTRCLAERAYRAGVPFVVTTLCEDIPSFHNQSLVVASSLLEYVRRLQDRNWWEQNRPDLREVGACAPFQNDWTARHAAALLTNGKGESAVLRRYYPHAKRIVEVMLGFEIGAEGNAADFVDKYRVRDFVLCVGRIESRKNQLMLLKALEDSDVPLVLVGGGFSYQPDYEQAVRTFKRRGPTLVLGRLSAELLAAAYSAAKVHALPSWYELPGLVSLEAAAHGCNLVAVATGTTPDYLENKPFYCDPASELSIYNAVMAAYYSPPAPGLKESVMQYRWEDTARRTFEVYREILSSKIRPLSAPDWSKVASWQYRPGAVAPPPADGLTEGKPGPKTTVAPLSEVSGFEAELKAVLDKGEEAAVEKRYSEAHRIFAEAQAKYPQTAALWRARGAVFLAEKRFAETREQFEQALALDDSDSKVVCGVGMCDLHDGKITEAYDWFLRALKLNPDNLTAIHGLMQASYTLRRYEDLESALRRYVSEHSADSEMRFCLAGCLYKAGRIGQAREIVEEVVRINPAHRGALELKEHLNKSSLAQPEVEPAVAQPMPDTARPHTDYIDKELAELEEAKRDGKYDAVIIGCRKILNMVPLPPESREWAMLLEAEALSLECELEEAESRFRQVLENNPRQARAWCGLGAVAAHRKDWQEARRHFERALELEPESDVALAGLGLLSKQTGDLQAAWQYYRRATQVNPENMRAVLGIIELSYTLGRLEELETVIRAYLELHPANLEFIYSLAGCLFAQNKLDLAAAEVEKIILFKPSHEKALELRQAIQEKRSPPNC